MAYADEPVQYEPRLSRRQSYLFDLWQLAGTASAALFAVGWIAGWRPMMLVGGGGVVICVGIAGLVVAGGAGLEVLFKHRPQSGRTARVLACLLGIIGLGAMIGLYALLDSLGVGKLFD
jgi:hypothetical protein